MLNERPATDSRASERSAHQDDAGRLSRLGLPDYGDQYRWFNASHNAWPAIAAELQELERWRTIFGCEDPQDAVYTTCEKPAARVLEERQAEIRRLEAELTRLREFEAAVRKSFETRDLQARGCFILATLVDLDRKRGDHDGT